jgi:hypothetical protein
MARIARIARIALACFEEQPNGSWICRRDTTIEGRCCRVFVKRNQLFLQGAVFAGFNNFTAHLANQGESRPSRAPHQWSGHSTVREGAGSLDAA